MRDTDLKPQGLDETFTITVTGKTYFNFSEL